MRETLNDLKVPGRRDSQADIFQLFRDWLQGVSKEKWLLVLDNVDDATFLFERPPRAGAAGDSDAPRQSGRRYLDYLPPSDHGAILVTSRNESTALRIVEKNNVIRVQPMNQPDALALLSTKLNREQDDPEQLTDLARSLDCVPLALAQAAAYIRKRAPRCSVRTYMQMLNKSDNSKQNLLNLDDGNLRRDLDANNSIILTWQISFDHIRSTQQTAADLLALMSFFDRQSIPEDLLCYKTRDDKEAISDDNITEKIPHAADDGYTTEESFDDLSEELDNDIQTLRDFSFISTRDGGSFTMHDLVRLSVRKWLKTHDSIDHWKAAFIRLMGNAFPTDDQEHWAECERLFPHAAMAVDLDLVNQDAIPPQGS